MMNRPMNSTTQSRERRRYTFDMACSGQQFCILLKEKKTKKYDEETTWQCTHGKDNSNNSSRCINNYNILVNIYKQSRLTVRCR
jgi:hypothetical protein